MKRIITGLFLFLTVNASAVVFDCQDGEEVETLILETHSASILGVTMINMMPVDWNIPYRGYARIGDPWYALDVDMNMARGKEGYATLQAHELREGTVVVSKFYQCTPSSH